MKIEKLFPLQAKYVAEYGRPTTEAQQKALEGIMTLKEYFRVEFIGLIEGEWKPLILANDGSLEVATERKGFLQLHRLMR